jgi:hypothetical protein
MHASQSRSLGIAALLRSIREMPRLASVLLFLS